MDDLIVNFVVEVALWNQRVGLAWAEWINEHLLLYIGVMSTLLIWMVACSVYCVWSDWRAGRKEQRRLGKEIEDEWARICIKNL